MSTAFFDNKGTHKEFVPAGQTITDWYYLNAVRRLRAGIGHVCSE